jgi:hypothetical protein
MNLMLYTPLTDIELQYRECAINGISLALHVCTTDEISLKDRYYIDRVDPGFTYIPVYGYYDIPKMVHIKAIYGVKMYLMWSYVFFEYFTKVAYRHPSNTPLYLDESAVLEIHSKLVLMPPNTTLVFVYDGLYSTPPNIFISEDSRDSNV